MIDLLWQEQKTKINTHPFFLELQSRHIEISKKVQKITSNSENPYAYVARSMHFSNEEKFTYETIGLFQEMHFKIDKVQQCHYMLDFYPSKIREAWFTPLTQGEYIEHIMELYLVHSLGLVDRLLRVYNFLFELGLDNQRLTVTKVIRAINIKKYCLPLYGFDMMLSGIRSSRNTVVHHYRYDDGDLGEVIVRDMVARDQYRASMKEADAIFIQLNRRYTKKISEIQKDMVKNDKLLTSNYLKVFNVLETQYRKKVRKIMADNQ